MRSRRRQRLLQGRRERPDGRCVAAVGSLRRAGEKEDGECEDEKAYHAFEGSRVRVHVSSRRSTGAARLPRAPSRVTAPAPGGRRHTTRRCSPPASGRDQCRRPSERDRLGIQAGGRAPRRAAVARPHEEGVDDLARGTPVRLRRRVGDDRDAPASTRRGIDSERGDEPIDRPLDRPERDATRLRPCQTVARGGEDDAVRGALRAEPAVGPGRVDRAAGIDVRRHERRCTHPGDVLGEQAKRPGETARMSRRRRASGPSGSSPRRGRSSRRR